MNISDEVKGKFVTMIGVAIIAYFIIKFVKDRLDNGKVTDEKTRQQNLEIKKQQVIRVVQGINKNRLSGTDQMFENWAKVLEGSFARNWPPNRWKQDNDQIKRVFNYLKTVDDCKMLILKYGIRDGKDLLAETATMEGGIFGSFNRSDLNKMMATKRINFTW